MFVKFTKFACQNSDYDLQFYCWEKFSDDWNTVFYQNRNALNCDEIVINRLVSRPIYRTLDEITIYKIVYDWAKRKVNSNTFLRQIMDPFLNNIRFFTMVDEFLKSYVYPEQFLTEEEVNAIQHYKATSDKSMIPDSICEKDVSRTNEKHASWFTYCNRSSSVLGKEINMKKKFQFISEIWVVENCFLFAIKLPISHSRKVGIKIVVKYFIDYNNLKIEKRHTLICKKNEYVKLKRAVYASKFSTVRLIVKINEDDITRSNIRIRNLTNRYILDKGMSVITGETGPLSKDIEYLYCDVKLYF
ncbi:uncharacterized protein LOC111622043 [Centruroides sculpturatus]|uniref:uncharacterized protein LOC111622043 n=1 Tax=Centruroides sculpturatus TaxID=218467 RepID=UPI000C6EBEA4|nr:uncharacterized protein LOC111622043 [Centruroides sculpturatus]